MLRNLTVQNYRCFENFHIDGLERVNLFVGSNNSGKTSLLETIHLLESNNKVNSLILIMSNRGEANFIYASIDNHANFIPIESIESLFYNYEISKNRSILIESTIQSTDSIYNKQLEIFYDKEQEYSTQINFLEKYNNDTVAKSSLKIDEENKPILNSIKISSIESASTKTLCILVSNPKKRIKTLQHYWNNIYLTDKEDKVVKAIQLLEPQIMRVGFYPNEDQITIKLKVKNQNRPIPLSSMGEGMYRFLLLAICLVTAENGVLLVDEIETGLHYEAQTDMWRLILETAKELNVQVFATTHSWDCIASFQEALEQVEDQSIGKLFRLDSKYGKLRAVEYNAEDLEIAVRHSIEVR